MSEIDIAQLCVPGSRLIKSHNDYICGSGTYEVGGYIFSTFAGMIKITEDENQKKVITVESPKTLGIIPKPGDVITARVTVVNPRQIQCTILCVGTSVLVRSYRGVIKKEYIRATDKDRVDPYKCFRPGDIIIARVLPITEVHWYHLTTAENELGVAIATADGSPPGVNMVPLSWSEMQCPSTLVKEFRKVARILPENLKDSLFPIQESF